MKDHRHWMLSALAEAKQAAEEGEVPVGAVLVSEGEVIGTGHNRTEQTGDPLAHAEMFAIRSGLKNKGRWPLRNSTLYVTLEPCAMCAGAAILARLPRLVFGVREEKTGACESVFSVKDRPPTWTTSRSPHILISTTSRWLRTVS